MQVYEDPCRIENRKAEFLLSWPSSLQTAEISPGWNSVRVEDIACPQCKAKQGLQGWVYNHTSPTRDSITHIQEGGGVESEEFIYSPSHSASQSHIECACGMQTNAKALCATREFRQALNRLEQEKRRQTRARAAIQE